MTLKKSGFAIVNAAFWPQGQVIGESLLQLAESVAKRKPVVVVTRSDGKLTENLVNSGRGKGVKVLDTMSRTDSSSKLFKRSLDAFFFMLWTFFCLARTRPRVVYVSTNPPLFVPFCVFIYSAIFRARYCYHVQDIHPEAANIVLKISPLVFKILQGIDSIVMRNAASLITISEEMKACILDRSCTKAPIYLLENPAIIGASIVPCLPKRDFVFCGNAGRLQRIPLLLDAIASYLDGGGKLTFSFLGAGLFAPNIKKLSERYESVTYYGYIPALEATEIESQHRWALLPIEDEVTRYAFPSKSSSYLVSNCRILAICGRGTSVARWVLEKGVGRVCPPEKSEIIAAFQDLEAEARVTSYAVPEALKQGLDIGFFTMRIAEIAEV